MVMQSCEPSSRYTESGRLGSTCFTADSRIISESSVRMMAGLFVLFFSSSVGSVRADSGALPQLQRAGPLSAKNGQENQSLGFHQKFCCPGSTSGTKNESIAQQRQKLVFHALHPNSRRFITFVIQIILDHDEQPHLSHVIEIQEGRILHIKTKRKRRKHSSSSIELCRERIKKYRSQM